MTAAENPASTSGADRPQSRQELIGEAAMEARVQQSAYDRFEDAAAAYYGVNRTAMRCMDVLDRLGQLTAGEIAVQTGLTSGAVTAMLDRLERDGLVQRRSDPSDRRRVLVQLTAKAQQFAIDIYGPLTAELGKFERYTDDQLRLIADFMRLATETLQRHADRVEAQAFHAGRQPARTQRDAARSERDRARAEREAGRTERRAARTDRETARRERQEPQNDSPT